jgi:ubiquinone biosynthesis protein COQ9
MTENVLDPRDRLLDAAIPHVPFDGWSDATFKAAVTESEVDPTVARATCPRGALDLAVAFHRRGDAQMVEALRAEDLTALRFRDRIARALRLRIEAAGDRELVRRGTTLFALPQHAPEGARLIWGTADAVWEALGDTSEDVNWYTKRMTLSAVYSATVLYWLGDTSEGTETTWEFLDRRIDDVMRIEDVKAQVRASPTLSRLMAGPNWLLSHVRAPARFPRADWPGSWTAPRRAGPTDPAAPE